MTRQGDLNIPSSDESLLIVDSGCDQSIINNTFKIMSKSGNFYNVDGALDNMSTDHALEVVNGITKTTTPNGTSYLLVVNQALYDPSPTQKEALLQPHQVRVHSVGIDDCAVRHRKIDGSSGGQCIQVNDITLPLLYDGWKCFLPTSLPTDDEMKELPWLEITSPLP